MSETEGELQALSKTYGGWGGGHYRETLGGHSLVICSHLCVKISGLPPPPRLKHTIIYIYIHPPAVAVVRGLPMAPTIKDLPYVQLIKPTV